MVILYNKEVINHPSKKSIIKKYKKNKHSKTKISRKLVTQQITTENKTFLKSLGLKLLV